MMVMSRLGWCVLAIVLVAHADRPGKDDWKYDVIYRKTGVTLKGLIVEQSGSFIRIRCIVRKPGSPTLVVTERIPRSNVLRLELLSKEDREILEQRLDVLKKERETLSAYLRALEPRKKGHSPAEDVFDFHPKTWPGDPKSKALEYRSTYFSLVTTARRELAELAVIQLEQIYDAYARLLPPRYPRATPTTILLTRSVAEYQRLAKARGLNLFNPAFFDPSKNQVVCGSDLEHMGDELEKVREHHDQLRNAIKEKRKELYRIYRAKIPLELLGSLVDAEKRINSSEKKNEAIFRQVRNTLFRRLYHEAFHAYAGNFVYPSKEGTLPVWLNEGLAQIFETAMVEVGELRVGAPDPNRLEMVNKLLKKGELLSLSELLRASPEKFQVGHEKDKLVADLHYLTAWAVSFHLAFERKVLGTKSLNDYVVALKSSRDSRQAFQDLVGVTLPEYEKELNHYLSKLRLDGSVGK